MRPLVNTAFNNKLIFLREVGGAKCLKAVLDEIIALGKKSEFWGGTLIVDTEVPLTCPIVVPAEFTLAGVGINGGGRLVFSGDFGGVPAVSFQNSEGGHSTIRDLAIIGPRLPNKMAGVKIGSTDLIADDAKNPPGRFHLHRVRVTNFGVYGMQGGLNARHVTIDSCQLIQNGVNIQLVRKCDGWRIRDTIVAEAGSWGVEIGVGVTIEKQEITGGATDVLISGCLFVGNTEGAVRVLDTGAENPTFGVFVFGNGFERNAGVALEIEPKGVGARLVANYLGEGMMFDSAIIPEDISSKIKDPLELNLGFNAVKSDLPMAETFNKLRTLV